MENKTVLEKHLNAYYAVDLKDFSIDEMDAIVEAHQRFGLKGADAILADIGMHKLTFFSMAFKYLLTNFYVFILRFQDKTKNP